MEVGLAPSSHFSARPLRKVTAAFSDQGPGGWLFREDAAHQPLAWLQMIDTDTWATTGCTGDESWSFAPTERRLRPALAAFANGSYEVATSRRRRFGNRMFKGITMGGG